MTYLEQLLDHCASLKLVLNPPHPGAFIQGRADQARILLAELEQEIGEIEQQDMPMFETVELKEKLYDDNSGKCYYCGEDTLWGESLHAENCAAFQELKELDSKGYDWDGMIWVGFEPSLYSQSQEWQQQDNEVDLWSDYGFSRGSFA